MVGVGYGEFVGSRGLTRGFAGVFAGATEIFPVRAMGYELCGMRMERTAVGKGKDRHGNPLTIKLSGAVEPYFKDEKK